MRTSWPCSVRRTYIEAMSQVSPIARNRILFPNLNAWDGKLLVQAKFRRQPGERMLPSINPLIRATASPAILESRAWLAAYDGSKGPAIDLSQAAPPYAPPPALLARLAAAAQSPATALYGPVPG